MMRVLIISARARADIPPLSANKSHFMISRRHKRDGIRERHFAFIYADELFLPADAMRSAHILVY